MIEIKCHSTSLIKTTYRNNTLERTLPYSAPPKPLSNLASPAPPPLSSSAEGLANGPIAHRLPARRARVPEGFKYPK